MTRSDRIIFFESLLDAFLITAKERGHITFEVAGKSDEYVQFQVRSGLVFGEVGSRQWSEPERPLSAAAVAALAQRGFTGGGPERNYVKDGLPRSKTELAALTESVFRTAYDLDDEYAPTVHHLNPNDVRMPRAQAFTRDMIEAQLRDHEVKFLRDQDGDFRAEFICEGSPELVTMWFVAEGDDEAIYRIFATASHRPVPATREEAVERCNRWNNEFRWPNALVMDRPDGGWHILVGSHLDLEPGVTKELFARHTDRVVTGALEFWEWIATPVGSPAVSDTHEQT
jgi:Putative bacterial sensory transduction regulator